MNEKLAEHFSLTLTHINDVRANLWKFIQELDRRAQIHDQSKLEEPEASIFAEHNPVLKKTKYPSPEYDESLKSVQDALSHHYADSRNRHHPQHFKNGIEDMDLLDILEMLGDWKAATLRMKEGNIQKSLDANAERFGLSPQFLSILRNTINRYLE